MESLKTREELEQMQEDEVIEYIKKVPLNKLKKYFYVYKGSEYRLDGNLYGIVQRIYMERKECKEKNYLDRYGY